MQTSLIVLHTPPAQMSLTADGIVNRLYRYGTLGILWSAFSGPIASAPMLAIDIVQGLSASSGSFWIGLRWRPA